MEFFQIQKLTHLKNKTMKQDTNTLDIPEPFMTDSEKKEYEQAKEIIQKSRKQKFENAIYDLKYYSQKRTVLETHLPEKEKLNNWDYNNCLEMLLEASKALLETYKKLNQ
tara:strand:- start:2402 stop:2731 length:330 start_codon:yes stop_codon:yes gene_type:complete